MPRVFVVGSGMVPFTRPASGRGYKKMASTAARQALESAGVAYDDVGACVCSYNYAAPTAGQAALYDLGLTGIPIFNTNNNCSAGSANIVLARSLILSGQYDVVLCVGFEEMDHGLSEPFSDRASPTAKQTEHMKGPLGIPAAKVAERMNLFTSDIIKLFAEVGREYCEQHGVSEEIFAEIAAKNRLHGHHNENAMLSSKSKKCPAAGDIAKQPKLFGCLTSGMAAPTGDGAAAIVLCSERWIREHGRSTGAAEILGQSLVSDTPDSFSQSAANLAGIHLAQMAAAKAYAEAGINPADIDAVELHDCFASNELLLYEALRLADAGKAADFWGCREIVKNASGIEFVRQGPRGVIVNPSGGLESKGHPIGATGLAQAAELFQQICGTVGQRQIEPRPRIAVQHNYGFNGGAVVTVYGAPVERPRSLTAPEIAESKVFAAGWGNAEEMLVSFPLGSANVIGKVPEDIRGTFFRNGPGIMDAYGTPLTHPIDGDGLIGRLTFLGDGTAVFAARFVETFTRTEEKKAGAMLFPGQMGSKAPSEERRWRDPAHTNVFEWGGRLLAIHEYTLPHELDPVTLRTVGPTDLGGALKRTRSLCAHYRHDQKTDQLVTVSFRPSRPAFGSHKGAPPKLHFCEFDRQWTLRQQSYHEVPGLNYVHDFAMTENYYIVHQTPFVKVDLDAAMRVLSGEQAPGEQMKFHPELPCRLVFIPRQGGDPILLDLPDPCHVYHFGHAYDSGDDNIEVDFVGLGPKFKMEFQHRLWLSNADEEPGLLYTARVDLKSRTCSSMRQADRCSCEFPAVHPTRHVNAPSDPVPRYTYLMANDSGVAVPFTHVVKVDRQQQGRQSYCFEGCTVGEPCFVPRKAATREDDGYVLVQVFEPQDKMASFAILDAAEIHRGPLCRLNLGRFLPNAFHGTWSNEVFLEPSSRL